MTWVLKSSMKRAGLRSICACHRVKFEEPRVVLPNLVVSSSAEPKSNSSKVSGSLGPFCVRASNASSIIDCINNCVEPSTFPCCSSNSLTALPAPLSRPRVGGASGLGTGRALAQDMGFS
eukprot:2781610-Amphidinium_carterae.1